MRRLAWVSDEVPGAMNNVAFTSTKIANERPDLVRRFLVAYREAVRIWHDAVADEVEHPRDGPELNTLLPMMAKFAGLSLENARQSIGWIDRDGRIDMADLRRQAAWYEAHGFTKGKVDVDTIVDRRYAEELPGG